MKIIFNTNKVANRATDGMYAVVEERFGDLEKFLKTDEPIKITVESWKKGSIRVKAQVVLQDNCHLRAEESGEDFYFLINDVKDNLKEQIVRRKEKHSRKEKTNKMRREHIDIQPLIAAQEEAFPKIVKVKHFVLEEITEAMAINEMEKLGHDQYIFKNIERDSKVCMLYKRFDDDYALIVIEG